MHYNYRSYYILLNIYKAAGFTSDISNTILDMEKNLHFLKPHHKLKLSGKFTLYVGYQRNYYTLRSETLLAFMRHMFVYILAINYNYQNLTWSDGDVSHYWFS